MPLVCAAATGAVGGYAVAIAVAAIVGVAVVDVEEDGYVMVDVVAGVVEDAVAVAGGMVAAADAGGAVYGVVDGVAVEVAGVTAAAIAVAVPVAAGADAVAVAVAFAVAAVAVVAVAVAAAVAGAAANAVADAGESLRMRVPKGCGCALVSVW